MNQLRLICAALLFGLVALGGVIALGADPAEAIRYRRVFVPQVDLDRVVGGLLPMKRDEFERRVQQTESTRNLERGPLAVRIDSAEYSARLEGDALVAGRATLSVVNSASAPQLLILDPANLALSSASWIGASAPAARLGVDPRGRLACMVESTGTLALSWSLAGRRDQRGDLMLVVRLPPSPRHRLSVALPQGLTLSADQTIVARTGAIADSMPETAGFVIWDVRVPGSGEVVLRVSAERPGPETEPLVLVKEQSTYAVHRGVIDLEAAFDLDVLHKPVEQLILSCDASVELLGIRYGEANLTWTPLGSAPGERRIAISPSPPLFGDVDAIRVAAVAKWDGERETRLPRIQIVNANWQDGRATVTADESLPVHAIALSGCRSTGFVPASPLRPQRQWLFQQYIAGSEIQIAQTQSSAELEEHSATTLEFGQTQVAGVYSAEISVASGARFDLHAEIPRAWIVDNLDVQPADALADRSLTSRPIANPPGDVQVLRLALRKPLVAGRPVRLTVRAHRRRPPMEQWLPDGFFSIVQLAHVRNSRRLLAWQTTDPTAQLILAGDEQLVRLDPSQLASSDQRLFEAPPVGELISYEQANESLRAKLVAAVPRFHADLRARASVEQENVRESWSILCTPEEAAVARFLVHFRPSISEPGQWRIAGEDSREAIIRALESSATAADESVFEVVLARPRKTPFEITAEFLRRRAGRQECALAYVPAAASQTGCVEVHADPGTSLTIETDRMQPAPPRKSPEVESTLRGCYRYEPGQSARLEWHEPPRQQAFPLAWVDSLELTSRYSIDGSGLHEATWKLRNAGDARFNFRLPAGADNVQARIEGTSTAGHLVPREQDQYAVALPDRRQCTILLSYATHDRVAGWHLSDVLRDPAPQCDLPILASAWRVELAPGLLLASLGQHPAPGLGNFDQRSPAAAAIEHEPNWSSYDMDPAHGTTHNLHVYLGAVVTAWSRCLAIAAAAFVVRFAAGRWASLAIVCGILLGTLAVLPKEFAALVLGPLGGLTLGAMWLLVIPRGDAARLADDRLRPQSTASLIGPSLSATSLILIAFAVAFGQFSSQAAEPGSPALRRVLIPVDGDRQPAGDYVYLEGELYDALLKLTSRSAPATPDCLLTSAVYRPSITTQGIDKRLHVGDIKAEFDIETFRADASIDLGFQRSEVLLVEGQTRLDGEPVLPEWQENGSRLRFQVREAGKHRLEMVLGARTQIDGGRERLEISIPRTSDCRLILPASASQISAESVRGSQNEIDGATQRVIHLGHEGKLILHWPRGGTDVEVPARIEAKQFVLWTVRPGSVTATGKFRLRPLGGRIREILIDLDPRLRVLPPTASGTALRQRVESAGSANVLHLDLAEPAAGEIEVPVAFLWAESSGIGNLSFPKIAVQADKVAQSWTGLALRGDLDWTSRPTARPGDPTSERFAEAWSGPLDGPVVAFDSLLPGALALSIQPSEPHIKASQLLECSVSARLMSAQYLATLTDVPLDTYQHRLKVSPQLQVTSVQITANGNEVSADWGQTADGSLLITQHQPATPQLELKLHGRVTIESGKSAATIPMVEFVGASQQELELQVFRQTDVRLAVNADAGSWIPSKETPVGQYQESLGRLAASYRQVAGSPLRPLAIEIEPNRPQPFGHLLARLVPGDPEWALEIDALVELESGVLDALRFELPPGLSQPLTITPAVEHEVIALPNRSGQLLIVRPQRPIEERLHLTIRGQFRPVDAQTITMPAIAMRGVPRLRQLVALPVRYGGQRIKWTTSGLQAIDQTALPAEVGALPAGFECYEAVAPRPIARAQLEAPQSPAPRIQVAEHTLELHSKGSVSGHTRLEVLPNGAQYLDLVMPPGGRFVHAAVEDVPAQLVRRGAGRFRIATLSSPPVQRLDVVYSAMLDPADAAHAADFAPPRIEGATIERTRWTIEPGAMGPVRWSETARGISIQPTSSSPPDSDARLVWLALAGAASAALAWVASSTSLRTWLGRQTPLLIAAGGALWLAAGPWPWLGWGPIGLAAWLALRFPWPKSIDRPLSSVLRRTNLS